MTIRILQCTMSLWGCTILAWSVQVIYYFFLFFYFSEVLRPHVWIRRCDLMLLFVISSCRLVRFPPTVENTSSSLWWPLMRRSTRKSTTNLIWYTNTTGRRSTTATRLSLVHLLVMIKVFFALWSEPKYSLSSFMIKIIPPVFLFILSLWWRSPSCTFFEILVRRFDFESLGFCRNNWTNCVLSSITY